jgi:excisionase family DNA binding protein
VIVLDIEGPTGAHLARAIAAHKTWCRANGHSLPAQLADLASHLATVCQGSPTRDDSEPFGDTPNVQIAFTFREAAEALRVSERGIYRLVEKGDLRAIEVAGRRRIHHADLVEFAERQRNRAA